MFIFSALINMINSNGDNFIQKEEAENFLKEESVPSIFDTYLKSIKKDVKLEKFEKEIDKIVEKNHKKTGENPIIQLKEGECKENYQKLTSTMISNIRDELYFNYGYKAQNKEAFDRLFASLLQESVKEGNINNIYDKFKNLEIKEPISMEFIEQSGAYDIMLPPGVTFSGDIDWSNSREIFKYLCFDENNFADTPPEHLPNGFNPQHVFDNGKSIGLGISEAHNMGYDGDGVSYAIIDSGARCENGKAHKSVKFKDYTVAPSGNQKDNHFHGLAVSYIAQEIAPKADLYYYAANNSGQEASNIEVLENLKAILEKNKSLPDDKKIRFVSMSMPLYGGEEAKKVVAELEAQGVWVFYSKCDEDYLTGYLEKKDPMGNSDDFDNYQIYNGAKLEILSNGTEEEYPKENCLYVNSGDRTVPDPSSRTAFRHDSRASQSWSVPVLAGYYVLACQADPNMTKGKFMRLASETAQIKESTMPIYRNKGDIYNDNDWVNDGRTKKTVPIKIIDINALLNAIKNEVPNTPETNQKIGDYVLSQYNFWCSSAESSTYCSQYADYLESHGGDADEIAKLRAKAEELDKILEQENDNNIAIKDRKVQNCGHRAEIVTRYLQQQGINNSKEIMICNKNMSFENREHVFNVIGMAENADTKDPRTWGKNAIIIDAWTGKTFTVQEALEYYKEFFGYNSIDDIQTGTVEEIQQMYTRLSP